MLLIRYVRILPYQRAVLFRDEKPVRVFRPGRHIVVCSGRTVRFAHFDVREPYLEHADIEAIVKSGLLMNELETFRLQRHERGLVWLDGRLDALKSEGLYAVWNVFYLVRHEVFSTHAVYLQHPHLDVLADSGLLDAETETVEIGDRQRGLVWVDGRFERVLEPGRHLLWTSGKRVRHEIVEIGDGWFTHVELETILIADRGTLKTVSVDAEHQGLAFRDGRFDRALAPGLHAYWNDQAVFKVLHVDLREQMLDISGQDVMSADKVTLRLNAVVTYRVADAHVALQASESYDQALYREAQLALRSVIAARELDVLLAEKERVTAELDEAVRRKAGSLGLEVLSLGLRDIILPGEMRTLMNRVTEAKKAAEANLIARREETQAMRSQANTARIFESNPTLMKLRELEVLEKVAERADLKVVLGEGGLADRLMHLV